MKKLAFLACIGALTVFLNVFATYNQEVQAMSPPSFVDPRLGLEFNIPKGWEVAQLDGTLGAAISLMPIDSKNNMDLEIGSENQYLHGDPHVRGPKIDIGIHTKEKSDDEDLLVWTQQYEELFGMTEFHRVVDTTRSKIKGLDVLVIKGESNITGYTLIHIEREKLVWFIWANDQVSPDDLDSILMSISMDDRAPKSREEILANILEAQNRKRPSKDKSTTQRARRNISSNFVTPLSSGDANCASAAHNNNQSKYAIDVGKPIGTPVRASESGTVYQGYDAGGFGNYVRIDTGGYKAYYAHLNSVNESIWLNPPYFYVYKWETIGFVGNTGNSGGAHLHFEIRNSSNIGVTLVGMSGFSAGAHYPYPGQPSNGFCGFL